VVSETALHALGEAADTDLDKDVREGASEVLWGLDYPE
jgi:hypothetical protein